MTIFDDIVKSLHSLLDLYFSIRQVPVGRDIQEYHCRIDDTDISTFLRYLMEGTYLEDVDVVSL